MKRSGREKIVVGDKSRGMKKGCGKKYLFRFDEEVHDHKFKRLIHRKSDGFAEIAAPKPSNVQWTNGI